MNRLQQKCALVSTGLHLLLALILVVGPGFLASADKKSLDLATIDCIPAKLIDAAFSDGGNPNATPPPIAPEAAPKPEPTPPPPRPPEPKPEPEKIREPELPKDTPKPKSDAPSLEPVKDKKPKIPDVSTTPILRRPNPKNSKDSKAKSEPAVDPRAQQFARARREAAEVLGSAGRRLRDTTASSSTSIETNFGPGGGGEAYANYGQVVKSVYEHAWIPPEDTASDDAITKATVTIASDGKVISAHIGRHSGDASVDRSVQRTLDRVTFIAPFPAGAKDKQRTYTINFNLKAKRLL